MHQQGKKQFPRDAKNDRSHHYRERNGVAAILWELYQEALNKGSSLDSIGPIFPRRLPSDDKLRKSQSQCLNSNVVKENGPQHIVHFQLLGSGMGSSLLTWREHNHFAMQWKTIESSSRVGTIGYGTTKKHGQMSFSEKKV